MCNIRIGDEI